MTERYAPAGKIWLCMMCGKTAKDCFADAHGWDESCAMNCLLVDEASKQPTELQVQAFFQERERHLQRLDADFEAFLQAMESDTLEELYPELLDFAQRIIDAQGQNPAGAASETVVQSPSTHYKEKSNG